MKRKNNKAKLTKLNLGCGFKRLDGYINVDMEKADHVDVVANLDKFPWPFKDSSAEYILLDNTLEHLEHVDRSMKEIHRILKPGGVVTIKVPYYNSANAHSPYHKKFFSRDSFLRFTTSFLKSSGLDVLPLFKLRKLELTPTRLGRIIPRFFRLRYLASLVLGEVIREIHFEASKV